MAAFGTRVTTVTQDHILPKVVDTILAGNFITYRVLSQGKKWNGETLKKPIKYVKSDLGGSFSGLDTHSTSTVDTRVLMEYDLRGYEMPVAIPGMDKAVNRTPAQVLNLVRVEVESAQEDACDDLGTMFYADGTGNSDKDFKKASFSSGLPTVTRKQSSSALAVRCRHLIKIPLSNKSR